MFQNFKIAIIYDWIDKWGGVERVLLTLHEMLPQAEFYTSYFDPKQASWAKDLDIRTSFINKLPNIIKKNRILSLPLYFYAFESFDFTNYDLVVSVTSSFAKSIITKPKTLHICYLLTPTRYLWVYPELYFKNKLLKAAVSLYLTKFRQWDFIAAQRPDHLISISKTAADRCHKYYKRKSEVIYPPFDMEYWKNIKYQISNIKNIYKISKIIKNQKRYFLIVSRLELYKKVDLVVQSFNRLDIPLFIVGQGSEVFKLKQLAKKNILFLKKLTDQELGCLYKQAEALIIPQEEDFGYTSLEAQFFGCPVIAYKKGGSTETIMENKTGIFFEEQIPDSLLNTLKKFHTMSYSLKNKTRELGIKNVERFTKEKFIDRFHTFLISKIK